MRWITTRRLARAYRLPWTQAKRIVREECLRAGARGGRAWALVLIHLTGLFWLLAGARWMFPTLHEWPLAGTESLGLLLTTVAAVLRACSPATPCWRAPRGAPRPEDHSEQLPLR